MTIQNISRLAALVAKYFHETPNFDYRIFRERQAEGNHYPFGNFVLILRRQDLGLAVLPELFAVPDGYELRQGRSVIVTARRPEEFGCAYRVWLEREVEYRIVTPAGERFDNAELVERQRDFLREAIDHGFELGSKCSLLVETGSWAGEPSAVAKPQRGATPSIENLLRTA
jgi:hypothetical protein